MSDIVGQSLGKYKLLEEIGRGGFGTVYRAYNPALDHVVALKVLDPLLMRDPGFLERFGREAKGTARLRHPNIVPIHDVGEDEGRQFIVMEYLPGRSLDKLIAAQGRLPVERALHILAQVAAALDYAHGKGLIHRDVKPSNIIVGPDEASGDPDHATLTDFGLLRATDQSIMTSRGQMLGTYTYMAPEQLDVDRQGEVGPASDLYAFGVVAYELLAGRPPFVGPTPALMAAHLTKTPPPVTHFNAELPPAVWAALAPALAKEVAERPANALALVARLRAALIPPEMPIAPPPVPPPPGEARASTPGGADQGGDAPVPPTPSTATASRPRRPWLPIAAVAILLAIIGLVWVWGRIFPPPAKVSQAEDKVIAATVVIEKTVERVVRETVVVEKPVEKVVIVTVIPPTATPLLATGTVTPLPPTLTFTPTATPAPPTLTPTRTVAPTTRPSPVPPTATPFSITPPLLLAPPPGETVRGRITLKWQGVNLVPGLTYQVVWWPKDADPGTARTFAAPTTETIQEVDISALRLQDGQTVNWAVLVVNRNSGARLVQPTNEISRPLVFRCAQKCETCKTCDANGYCRNEPCNCQQVCD